jgi:hypothetical protein
MVKTYSVPHREHNLCWKSNQLMLCEDTMHVGCLNDIKYKHTESKNAEFNINVSYV